MITCLNLDSKFEPIEGPQILYKKFVFSGGERHIEIGLSDYKASNVVITNRIVNSGDIIDILIAKDALTRLGATNIELVTPYLPYARQDRVCNIGEAFTLKVFADLINSANFRRVTIIDSHSDVGPALLNNCLNIPNTYYVKKAFNDIDNENLVLVSPDSGANKKTNKLFDSLNTFKTLVKCDKTRDTSTGKLSKFEVFTDDLQGKPCLIVDDICDGGRTFIGIAEALKAKNAGALYLFVTHGIFSNSYEELNKYFSKIYCTNSFKDIDNSNVKQFKIQL